MTILEKLLKYLYEKEGKLIKLCESSIYSMKQMDQLLTKNIPNMVSEYTRIKHKLIHKI